MNQSLATPCDTHASYHDGVQTEERKRVFEITEVNPEDMELILKFIYGALDAIPDERVQPLYLATERLEVCCLPDLPAIL